METMQRTLPANLRLMAKAMDNAVEGIIITDMNMPDQGIIYANKAFYSLTGYSPAEVIEKNCRFLQGEHTEHHIIEKMRRCITEQKSFQGELLNYKKSGEPFWNSLTMVPIIGEDGKVTHYTGSQNDVTVRKTAEARAAELLKELEAFNYTVSHDLRAPLRLMKSFSTNLLANREKQLTATDLQQLEFIRENAAALENLVNTLLEFSKGAGAQLNLSHVNITGQVTDVVAALKLTEQFKGKITVHALPDAVCDAALIRQVWVNLIGNAIKYSGNLATTEIEIGYQTGPFQNRYYIRDNGMGFDTKHAESLFLPFQRNTNNYEGFGIGLATVKRIIDKHCGKIWAEGVPGEGATFYIALPGLGVSK